MDFIPVELKDSNILDMINAESAQFIKLVKSFIYSLFFYDKLVEMRDLMNDLTLELIEQ